MQGLDWITQADVAMALVALGLVAFMVWMSP
jgi:hypothetical protein